MVVDLRQLQPYQLRAPHSRGVKQLQHGAVADADRIGDVRLLQHQLGFVLGQHGRQPVAQPWQLQLRGRIVQDVVLPRHPLEPHPQRHQPRVLAGEAQRLPVLFAVVEQVTLIAFEHGPRDLERLGEPVFAAPVEEHPDMHPAHVQRALGEALHRQMTEMFVQQRGQRRLRFGLGFAAFPDAGHQNAPAARVPFALAPPLGFTGGTTMMPLPFCSSPL